MHSRCVRERDALIRAGVATDNLYVDHTSGAKSSRPQSDVVCQVLCGGDVLVCTRLDRVGRSTAHLVGTDSSVFCYHQPPAFLHALYHRELPCRLHHGQGFATVTVETAPGPIC